MLRVLGLPRKRRAIPADEKGRRDVSAEKAIIADGEPETSGKLNSAGLKGSGVAATPTEETYAAKMWVPIIKASKERRTITGVVLEPDTVDAHKDTIPANVILDAAEDFLAEINVETTLGVQHKDFKQDLQLVQSFVVSDSDITINAVIVKKGSWVITVRVNSDAIWKQIKDGKLTGFSIGGKATVQDLEPQAA